jgi:Putative Flp pilus-assembly TadE/G-like
VGARTGARPGDARLGHGLGGEGGNVLVVFALFLPLFLIVCAVVIDVGYWWANAKKTQIAADACALAAARELPATWTARPDCMFEGRDYALTNLPLEGLAEEPRHRNTSVTSPYAPENATYSPTRYVEARVTLTVRTFFGRIVGLGHIDITRRAVAEKKPPEGQLAIYAHDDDCSSDLKFNGHNINVDGGVHSNSFLSVDGLGYHSGPTTYGQGCNPDIEPGSTFDSGPTPVPKQTWPEWYTKGADFTCDKPPLPAWSTPNSTIPTGTYCQDEFKIDANNVSGTITVVANKITINGNGLNLSAREGNDVLFFIPPNSTSQTSDDGPDPYTCDHTNKIEFNGNNYDWEGTIFNPCGSVIINAFDTVAGSSLLLGQILGFEVTINSDYFNMIGTGDATGDFALALFE